MFGRVTQISLVPTMLDRIVRVCPSEAPRIASGSF